MERIGQPPTTDLPLDWGVASWAMPGESETGDIHLVAPYPGGFLFAVADGLGHGAGAAFAARQAIATLAGNAALPVVELMRLSHEALHNTRGAALALVSLRRDRTLQWLSVGNVDAALVRAAGGAPDGARHEYGGPQGKRPLGVFVGLVVVIRERALVAPPKQRHH